MRNVAVKSLICVLVIVAGLKVGTLLGNHIAQTTKPALIGREEKPDKKNQSAFTEPEKNVPKSQHKVQSDRPGSRLPVPDVKATPVPVLFDAANTYTKIKLFTGATVTNLAGYNATDKENDRCQNLIGYLPGGERVAISVWQDIASLNASPEEWFRATISKIYINTKPDWSTFRILDHNRASIQARSDTIQYYALVAKDAYNRGYLISIKSSVKNPPSDQVVARIFESLDVTGVHSTDWDFQTKGDSTYEPELNNSVFREITIGNWLSVYLPENAETIRTTLEGEITLRSEETNTRVTFSAYSVKSQEYVNSEQWIKKELDANYPNGQIVRLDIAFDRGEFEITNKSSPRTKYIGTIGVKDGSKAFLYSLKLSDPGPNELNKAREIARRARTF